jgi:hypothetical protein
MRSLGVGVALVGVMLTASGTAAARLADFAQVDHSDLASTLVLVRALPGGQEAGPAPLLTAAAVQWSTGEAGSLGYAYRWALPAVGAHVFTVGLGAGIHHYRDREVAAGERSSDSGLAARVLGELGGPAPGGSYYGQVQASAFRSSWLAGIQYSPRGLPFGIDFTRYSEEGFQSSTTALRVPLGVRHWAIRVGAIRAEQEYQPFLGTTYNAF